MMRGIAATARVAGIAVTLVSLYACTPSSVTVNWTEDVRLGNGRVVTVERKETSHTAGQWWQGTDYYLTTARLRARNGATWLTTEWSAPVRPLFFDRDEATGDLVIVGMPDECQFFQGLGAPDSFYVEYRFRQGAWQRVPLSDFSVDHAANLLLTVHSTQETGHVSLEQKSERDSDTSVYWRALSVNLSGSNPCSGRPVKK